jgi:hypothetical protein
VSQSESSDRLRSAGLLPHQVKFVVEALGGASRPRVVLSAPTGTGKSRAVAALVAEFVHDHPDGRVALVTPASLVAQAVGELATWVGTAIPIEAITARTYRQLVGQQGQGAAGGWPQPMVAVWNTDAIANNEVVRNAWLSFPADLIVVDEAYQLAGVRADLIGGRLKRDVGGVLMTPFDPKAVLERLPDKGDWSIVVWGTPLVGWNGEPIDSVPAIERKVVAYSRTDEEESILALVDETYSAFKQPDIYQSTVFLAASSSLFALESVLLRRRNRLAHGMREFAEDFDEDLGATADALPVAPNMGLDSAEELSRLQSVLDRLSQVRHDSKLEAFMSQFGSIGPKRQEPIITFTQFLRTQDYLMQALSDRGHNCAAVNGSMGASERLVETDRIASGGGVLVVTDGGMQGLEFGGFAHAVHFDLPRTVLIMSLRLVRVHRAHLGRVTHYAMRDRKQTYPLEEQLLAQYEFTV